MTLPFTPSKRSAKFQGGGALSAVAFGVQFAKIGVDTNVPGKIYWIGPGIVLRLILLLRIDSRDAQAQSDSQHDQTNFFQILQI